jgi:hypothetical protein
MSNGQIRYTITADDRMSDVVAKVRGNFGQLKEGIGRIAGEFRRNGWGAGVKALGDLRIQSAGAIPGMRTLLGLVNPATVGIAALGVAAKLSAIAMRALGHAMRQAASFQKDTFDLAPLVGGVRKAREVMLQLTEGKQAVDHVFGSSAVKDAYRDLHNFSGGALATAENVRLMGEMAARSGKSIGDITNKVGLVWQRLVGGQELGSLREMFQGMQLDPNLVNELQQLREAGASAGDLWARFWQEIQKADGSIKAMSGSLDMLDKQIADAKGTIATSVGEWFTPMRSAFKSAWAYILEKIADLVKNPVRITLQLIGLGRVQRAVEQVERLFRKDDKNLLDRFDRKPQADTETKDAKGAADKAEAEREKADADAAQQTAWREVRDRERERREAERTGAMSSGDLYTEAYAAQREGRAGDYERLRVEAEKRQAQEAADREARHRRTMAERDKRREEQERADEQAERAADAAGASLAAKRDAAALEAMDPRERLAEIEWRAQRAASKAADARGGREDSGIADPRERLRVAGLDEAAFDLRQRAARERAAVERLDTQEIDAMDRAAADRRREQDSLLKQAADARGGLAGMAGIQRSGISTAERADWMRSVRAGRSPEEQIVENTRRMAELLGQIAKAEGVQ